MTRKSRSMLDITRSLASDVAEWPGDSEFAVEWTRRIQDGEVVNLSRLSFSPHVATHVDAPLHFSGEGAPLEDICFRRFLGQCLVVDVSDTAGPDSPVDRADLNEAICRCQGEEAQRVPSRLLVRTGYVPRRPFNHEFAHFTEGAVALLGRLKVGVLGTDAPSVDPFDSHELLAHRCCLAEDIYIIENLDLQRARAGFYELYALPTKIEGVEAAPVRAVLFDSC